MRRVDHRRHLAEAMRSFSAEVESVTDPYGLLHPRGPETERYVRTLAACEEFAARAPRHRLRHCDLGGYFGIITAAISGLGYDSELVDSYGSLLKETEHRDLHAWWRRHNIPVHDIDLQTPSLRLPFDDASFDVVTLLAVLEHFPHTPRLVLTEIHRILRPDGMLIVDCPNAGAFGVRVGFLMHGEGLWAPISELYFSDIPFPGHSRCYSRGELVQVLQWAGFEPTAVDLFDLPDTGGRGSFRGRLLYGLLYRFVLRHVASLRNCIWVTAQPQTTD
jgi:SAM-dependent methyltransferase